MKVVLNTCWAGPFGAFRPGDIADVKPEVGQELIDGGYAKLVPSKKEAQAKQDKIDRQANEDADQPRKVGGRRGRASGLVGSGN